MQNNIEDAIRWANKRLLKQPSTETREQYKTVMARMFPMLKNGYIPGSKNNRNTRSVERSAFKFYAAAWILKSSADKPSVANFLYSVVLKIQEDAASAQLKYSRGEKFPNKQSRGSKRKNLNTLPNNWRIDLLKEAKGSRYENHIKVMSICGCRPSEFEKGVTVKRQGSSIIFTVHGAKCSEENQAGQEWRTLEFDSDHPLAKGLTNQTYIAKAKAISDAVAHFGRKVNEQRSTLSKYKISAYSLRHAVATELKSCGIFKKDVAAALGHQSDATMSFYGTNTKGKGSIYLKSVKAAIPVRSKYKKKMNNNTANL